MREGSCLGHHVDCYNVSTIEIGRNSTVSQYSFLCTASHDFTRSDMPLVAAPIHIGDHAWITSDVFVGPGVSVGIGAVILARSTVTRDIPSWVVAGGNPSTVLGVRHYKNADEDS
jgi:putative colanic acid biosynthesis acetyltransferase WcaF